MRQRSISRNGTVTVEPFEQRSRVRFYVAASSSAWLCATVDVVDGDLLQIWFSSGIDGELFSNERVIA